MKATIVMILTLGLLPMQILAASGPTAPRKGCPLTVIANVKVKKGTESQFKQAAQSLSDTVQKGRLAGINGNLVYRFHQAQDQAESNVFATYEKWERNENLDAHMKAAYFQDFIQRVGPLFEEGYPMIHLLNEFGCSN